MLVFKFKTKTGYKLTQGHRQQYTRLLIESITQDTKSKSSEGKTVKEVKKKAPTQKKESKVSGS